MLPPQGVTSATSVELFMGWQQLVDFLNCWVSFGKEPYYRRFLTYIYLSIYLYILTYMYT